MSARPIVKGGLSFRPCRSANGTAYAVARKGAGPSDWNTLARLYPATDGASFIVSIERHPFDARPSLEAAMQLVIERTGA